MTEELENNIEEEVITPAEDETAEDETTDEAPPADDEEPGEDEAEEVITEEANEDEGDEASAEVPNDEDDEAEGDEFDPRAEITGLAARLDEVTRQAEEAKGYGEKRRRNLAYRRTVKRAREEIDRQADDEKPRRRRFPAFR